MKLNLKSKITKTKFNILDEFKGIMKTVEANPFVFPIVSEKDIFKYLKAKHWVRNEIKS